RHLPAGFEGAAPDGGRLIFALDPDELRIDIHLSGDDPFTLERKTLNAVLSGGQSLAYTEVLEELLDGNVRLSVRGDEAEECWRIVQPVRDAWARDEVPLEEY